MVFIRIVCVLCLTIFGVQVVAMHDEITSQEKNALSSNAQACSSHTKVKEEIEKIEGLVKRLKSIESVDFDFQKASVLLQQQAPDYSMNPEKVTDFYENVAFAATGGEAWVLKGTLKEERPQAGLKQKTPIAIRMVARSNPKPRDARYKNPQGCEPLIRGAQLRYSADKKRMTEYFPEVYGIYYGPAMPEKLVIGEYNRFMKDFSDWIYRYEEMEWVDTTFEKKFCQNWQIPNSVILEWTYGEWVGEVFGGFCVTDPKPRNYGLKTAPYGRCYHFGKDLYYFPPGEMPVRLDLSGFVNVPHPTKERFHRNRFSGDKAETQEGKEFLKSLSERNYDIFSLFKRYFVMHLKEETWVAQEDPVARHYYLDQKWIDIEKSLPVD